MWESYGLLQTNMDEQVQEQPVKEAKPEEVQLTEGVCDSCGKTAELIETPHQQEGNETVHHYCADCKALHDKEIAVNSNLKELAKTHPQDANSSAVAALFHEGHSVEDVKKYLDTHKEPELEAEVVE